jgi:ATP-dependent RNA helicase SUPV3L1/SUV3
VRKFDGHVHRSLTPGELGQIAGRAGRHMNDGTFGVTGGVEPFDPELVERLETHTFDNVRVLQWRNRTLDFSTLDALRDSLRAMPREQRLTRARMADDVLALETVSADREVASYACAPAAVARLWDVCQVPDYRKISSQNHAELVATLYKFLMSPAERIPEDWFAKQVAFADRTDGDIDTLANRIAHIRTWTFVSNRADWLNDPAHWQARTRAIEDALSDALHERLTQRFVDKRTSALMRGMRDKEELNAEIAEDGAIKVENHYVGRLKGFRYIPDAQGEGIHGKAARHAAAQVLSRELAMRVRRVASAKPDAFKLTRTGRIVWRDEEIARLEASEQPLKPAVVLLVDEHTTGPDRERLQARLDQWMVEVVGEKLKPLVEIAAAEDITGLARGIAFRLVENFGVLKRDAIGDELKSLDQNARAQLRKYGLRFGAFNIYFPQLLKPAAVELSSTLWALKHGPALGLTLDAMPEPPRAGLTSVAANPQVPDALYRAYGFHLCGPRAVRLDILERLADQIRPLLAFRATPESATPPPRGSTGDGGFTVIPEMMSVLGCTGEDVGHVLRALGFRLERRPLAPPSPESAVAESASSAAGEGERAEAAPAVSEEVPAAAGVAQVEVPPATAAAPDEAVPAASAVAPLAEPTAAATVTAAEEVRAPAEPQFVEIWRPRRHKHTEHRRPNRGPAEQRARSGPARQGGGQHAPGDKRRGGERPQRGPGQGGGGAPAAAAQGSSPDRQARRVEGDSGKAGRGGRPDERGRRRPDRERERRRPEIISSSPPRKADPDSPFAALGALKEALEKRGKDSNTTS